MDGGTISLESGSIIVQTIQVTENGGGLAVYTTDDNGTSTLTLNGTIEASSLSDIALDLSGVNLVLGKDFAIVLDYDLTEDEVSVFQNLASFSNENYYITVTVGGSAVDKVYFSYDGGTLSVVPEPATASLSLLALTGLLLRRRRKA